MSSRSSFATPTNVNPKNGGTVVFNEDNEAIFTFTNNTDSLMFVGFNFYNLDAEGISTYDVINWHYSAAEPVTIINRGETYRAVLYRKRAMFENSENEDEIWNFEIGGHYGYNITLFSAYPREQSGETVYLPNANVKFASGKLLGVTSETQVTIAKELYIPTPVYYGEVTSGGLTTWEFTEYPQMNTYIVCACYIEIYGKQAMITSYDPSTGEATLFTALTPIRVSPTVAFTELASGMHYNLYCNFISSSGNSSDGAYDLYVRHQILTAANANPVPGAYRCQCLYTHPDDIGLEKYRFRVYRLDYGEGTQYINGLIGTYLDDNDQYIGADRRHIPIEKNIATDIKNKQILLGSIGQTGRLSSGEWGIIINYDKVTGIATLDRELSNYPAKNRPYTIELCDRVLMADSNDCYSWHTTYNFPIYTFGQTLQIETILTSYEKQTLDSCTTITVAEPELTFDYGQVNDDYSIEANPTNQTVELTFSDNLITDTAQNDRFFALYRRETTEVGAKENPWQYLGFIRDGKTYTDYLAANNTSYDYLISRTVEYINSYDDPPVDILHEYDWNPAEEAKAYAFDNAVATKWDGWTITAIYPCEGNYITNPMQAVREDNGHYIMYNGSYRATIAQFVCSKTPFKVGDTWSFFAAIDSGEIVHNLNRTVHVGTSTYPSVTGTNNKYQSGTFTTDILSLECPSGTIYDNIEKVNRWNKFITDDCLFILKSDKGDVWIVAISDNPFRSYDESVADIITKVSYSWTEVASPDEIQIVEY